MLGQLLVPYITVTLSYLEIYMTYFTVRVVRRKMRRNEEDDKTKRKAKGEENIRGRGRAWEG